MIRHFAIIIFYTLSFVALYAQQRDSVTVSGRVTDTGGEPIEALIITVLQPSDSSVIAYGMTDIEGHYMIDFMTENDEIMVRLTGFNVKREVRRVNAVTQTLDFKAEEQNITLREVQIKAQKLWGNRDTLNYLVATYTKEHDRTIGDVLKQLPGITVDGGIIRYQGTPINHFYIENMDVLQGRYNIATKGIRAEDVATVQVLENHESIKALQDQVPPESAAINLKLKEKAKGLWTKSFELGVGYNDDFMWNCEGNLMYFGRQRQHVMFYGSDNAGREADRSSRQYGGNGLGTVILTDIIYPGLPPVGSTLRNNRHALHLSNLNKLSETAQIHYNLNYSHDIRRSESHLQTTYLLPGEDMRVICEDIASRHTTNDVEIRLSYENNTEKKYLCSTLDMSGQWSEANGTVFSNTDEIRQHVYHRNLGVANHTHWIYRTDGGGFDLSSRNTVQMTPQALSVSKDRVARQEVDITRVGSSNNFSLLKDIRKNSWSVVPTAALNMNYVGVKSMLRATISDKCDMDYLNVETNLGATLRYVKNEFRLTFRLPLVLSYTDVVDEVDAVKVRFSPSFGFLWKADDNWTFSGNGYYGMSQTSWEQLITAYIMRDYRTTSCYVADLTSCSSVKLDAKINYKDIMSSFFAYLQGSASCSWSDIIYGTAIDKNNHTIIQAEYMPHHNDIYSLTGNISKGFGWKDTKIEMNVGYTRNNSLVLRQSAATDFHCNVYHVHGNFSCNIINRIRIGYGCDYTYLRSMSQAYTNTIHTFSQRGNLYITIIPNSVLMNMTACHTHNGGFQGKKDYAFLDCSFTYRMKKRQEFVLEVCNVFNTRTFVSRSDAELTESITEYHLLPRSIMFTTRFNI